MRVFIVLLLVLSLLLPAAGALVGCSEGAGSEGTTLAVAGSPVTLDVEGMTCEACESAIQAAVEKLPGVRSCTASHSEKVARVEIAEGARVDVELVAATIEKLGYTVKTR